MANFLVCFHWKKITTRKLNKLKRLFYNSYAISRLWKLKHLYFYWIFFVLFHFIFCSSNVINKIRFWPDFIGFRRSIQNRARTFIQIQMPKALLEPGLLLIALWITNRHQKSGSKVFSHIKIKQNLKEHSCFIAFPYQFRSRFTVFCCSCRILHSFFWVPFELVDWYAYSNVLSYLNNFNGKQPLKVIATIITKLKYHSQRLRINGHHR